MTSRMKDKIDATLLPIFGTLVVTGLVSMASIWTAVAVAVVGLGGVALALDND